MLVYVCVCARVRACTSYGVCIGCQNSDMFTAEIPSITPNFRRHSSYHLADKSFLAIWRVRDSRDLDATTDLLSLCLMAMISFGMSLSVL